MPEEKEFRAIVKVRSVRGGTGHTSYYVRIPKKIARSLGIKEGDELLLEVKGEVITLRKVKGA